MSQASQLTLSSVYSAGGENFLFWDYNMSNILKTDSFEIFRTTTAGSYGPTPEFTNAPLLDTRGVNPYVDYAKPIYNDKNVANGTTYYYKVRVKTIDGQYGPFSPEVSVQTRGARYYISGSGSNANSGSSGSPWQSLTYALTQITRNAGHVLVHKVGTYNYSQAYDMNGISLEFESGAVMNSLFSYTQGWWDDIKPVFKYAGAGNAHVYLRNLKCTTANTSSRGWAPIWLEGKTGVWIENLDCEYYFRAAVQCQTSGKNICILNSNLRNNGQEESGFSTGNWTLKGSFTNFYAYNNTVDYQQKGYGAKIHYAYIQTTDTLKNARISFNTFTGKTGSAFAPEYNISHECFRMLQDGVVKSNNYWDMHTSDDTNTENPSQGFAYYHHHNTAAIKRGQMAECASSHTIVEDTFFDNRNNANAWGGIGEFNSGQAIHDKVYRRNLFIGNGIYWLFVWTCNVYDLTFEYNTVQMGGQLFGWNKPNSNGAKSGFKMRYNVFDGAIKIAVKGEGADGSLPQFVANEGNLFRSAPDWNGVTPFAVTVGVPALQRTGNVPDPYWRHQSTGNASDKGAFQTTIAPPVVTNNPPAVAISSPASGSGIVIGQSVTISFTATDSDGSIANRYVILDGVQTAVTGNSYTWTPSTVGSHTFAVKAVDNQGAETTTPTRTLTVSSVVTPPVTPSAATASKNLNLTNLNGRYIITLNT